MTPSPSIVNDHSEHKIALKFYATSMLALVRRTLSNKKSMFFNFDTYIVLYNRSSLIVLKFFITENKFACSDRKT